MPPTPETAVWRMAPFFAWTISLGLWLWAVTDPRFREVEGFLDGFFVWPVSVGIGCAGWGLLVWLSQKPGRDDLRPVAHWLTLALVGQSSALQLILAGSPLRYQHYKPVETHPAMLLLLAGQTLLVAWGLWSRRLSIWHWLQQRMSGWRWFLLAALVFVPAATVSASPVAFALDLALAVWVQAVNLGNIILVAWALPATTLDGLARWFRRLLGKEAVDAGASGAVDAGASGAVDAGASGAVDRSTAVKLDTFSLVTALVVTLAAAWLNIFPYQQHPHVTDEFAYIYHARFLAAGVLDMPAPPVPEAFDVYLMELAGDRWYPSPPPGWPAFLSIGTRLGADWLVNPILGGVNLLLIYLLLQSLYGQRTARWSVLLLAVSPWYVFLAMSYMTHMATLTCALLAAIGVDWTRRTGNVLWAWSSGLSLGMLAHIRPFEAAAVAVLVGLWAIGVGGKRIKLIGTAGMVIVTMLVGLTVLVYNDALTGDPTTFPIMAYTDTRYGPNANALGFGPDRGMGWALDPNPGHSPLDAMINADLNTFAINVEMYGWSIGSLLFSSLLICAVRWRRERVSFGDLSLPFSLWPLHPHDYLMLTLVAVIWLFHFFYYYSGGPDFGARYWFLMIVPVAVLTARGIELAEGWLGAQGTRVTAVVLSLCLLSVVTFFPWRAIDKYHNFREMRPDVRLLAEEYDFGRSLVLIRGKSNPDYASAAIYNPLDLQNADAPIYAWDRSPAVRAALFAAYPDRPVWIIDGPTITGRGFEVAARPK